MLKEIKKPKRRGWLRRVLGKEFFILKRSLSDKTSSTPLACSSQKQLLENRIVSHDSHTLRPLKKVEMYLQENKVTNLKLAIEHLDGLLIKPGETFSFWKLIGRPTKSKGYLEGLILKNGEIAKGTGGGLCQLGNMLYWMFLHTSLTVTERWRHSYDVFPDVNRTLPFGCGATLAYNYIDLRAKNSTNQTYQLHLWFEGEMLCGEIRSDKEEECSFEIVETDHLFKKQWWGGYTRHNRIWQHKKSKHSANTERQLITENHAIMMYNPLIEYDTNKLSGDTCE